MASRGRRRSDRRLRQGGRRQLPLPLILALLLGCSLAPSVAVADAPLDEAHRLLATKKRPNDARLRALVERLTAACLAATRPCADLPAEVGKLLALVGEGDEKTLPLLLRLEARQVDGAAAARERVLVRLSHRRCAPPSAAEVARQRKTLHDYVVLRHRGGALVGEPPLVQELDDLAYFLAATEGAGPEVAAAGPSSPAAVAPSPAVDLAALVAEVHRARLAGDAAAVVRSGRSYLGALGFPGPINSVAEKDQAFGGPRSAYLLRDVASAEEILGHPVEAALLYRRANPGGGVCGSSVSFTFAEQVRGVVRAEERAGRCRAAVAERLLAVDDPLPGDHGPRALAAAGFDVARLYRGALVTVNRDGDEAEVRRAAGPRHVRQNREDWERRVQAIEGLAASAGRAALPRLLALIAEGTASVRARTLHALGRLLEKPAADPCDSSFGGLGLTGSTSWTRNIEPLGATCATRLRPGEVDPLLPLIVAAADDTSPEVRATAAEALGAIAAPSSRSTLVRLAADPHQVPGQICEGGPGGTLANCRPNFPVREAARTALRRLPDAAPGAQPR